MKLQNKDFILRLNVLHFFCLIDQCLRRLLSSSTVAVTRFLGGRRLSRRKVSHAQEHNKKDSYCISNTCIIFYQFSGNFLIENQLLTCNIVISPV